MPVFSWNRSKIRGRKRIAADAALRPAGDTYSLDARTIPRVQSVPIKKT